MCSTSDSNFLLQLADAQVRYLQPGDIMVGKRGELLYSVIGSCVCVCLYAPGSAIGGMNHFMLARAPQTGDLHGRYGPTAMQQLLDAMLRRGVNRDELHAKIFGGSAMRLAEESAHSVGQTNIAFARQWLHDRGIPIKRQDVGGHQGRKIYFDSASHTVWLKHIRQLNTR